MKKVFLFFLFFLSIVFGKDEIGVVSYYAKQAHFTVCPLTIKWLDKSLVNYSFKNSWWEANRNFPNKYPFYLNLEGLYKDGSSTFITLVIEPRNNKDCSFHISKKMIFNQSCIYLASYFAKQGFEFKGILNQNISVLMNPSNNLKMFLTPITGNKCYVESQDGMYDIESFLEKHKNLLN
jgi:hypothetical protein